MDINLLGGSHLLRALGFNSGGLFNALEDFQSNLGVLQDLGDSFGFAAGFTAGSLAGMLQSGGIPGAGVCMPPMMSRCPCPGSFAQPRNFDFGATPPGTPSLLGKMNRKAAGKFERYLSQNPFARAQVEMMLGGRIIPDGRNDGKITVQPFGTMPFPGGSPHAMAAMSFLDQVQRGAMNMGYMAGAHAGGQANMFQSMMLGAFANLLAGGPAALMGQGAGGVPRSPGGGSPFVDWAANPGQANGQHQTMRPGPHQAQFGMSGQDEVSAVLNDSSLTVEDKVTLMIMLIMKQMDKDIEKQANYINQLQQQQSKEGGGGGGGGKGGGGGGKGGGGGGGGGGGSSPSIDVETMKLKRMIDKRGQMFDMLRQIIDKYNETAKNIIQSIGR